MKKLGSMLFTASLATVLLTSSAATVPDEEAALKTVLQLYLTGDADKLEQAFHTSASMKYIDNKTGQFTDVPIADFIARVRKNGAPGERKTEILSYNIDGNAAQAKLRIETPKVIFVDYMNLLKVGGQWKIVSKIFTRTDKN